MDLPDNLKNELSELQSKMDNLKDDVIKLISSYDKVREDIKGSQLEEASLDLATAFTINSLFWIYLTTKGIDPKNHTLLMEINRIKQANIKLKQLKESVKAPKIDVKAAQRFIVHSLFDPKNHNNEEKEKGYEADGCSLGMKRKRNDDDYNVPDKTGSDDNKEQG